MRNYSNRLEFQYVVSDKMESADDLLPKYNDKDIQNFIKHTIYLEDNLTKLKNELVLYDNLLYIVHKDFSLNKLNLYLGMIISDLTENITLSFSRIISNGNKYSIIKYVDMYSQNSFYYYEDIQRNDSIIKKFEDFHNKISSLMKEIRFFYEDYLKDIRNKLFAHNEELYFNFEKLNSIFSKIGPEELKEICDKLIMIMNLIWKNFRNKELSFEIVNEDKDLEKILKKFETN